MPLSRQCYRLETTTGTREHRRKLIVKRRIFGRNFMAYRAYYTATEFFDIRDVRWISLSFRKSRLQIRKCR